MSTPKGVLYNAEFKVVYHVEVKDLEYCGLNAEHPTSPFHGLPVLPYHPEDSTTGEFGIVPNGPTGPHMSQEYFDEEWSGTVIRTAIDSLLLHDRLDGAYFYLGRFTDDPAPGVPIAALRVAVLGKEMDTYGSDITYNGFRVTVVAHEVTWGVD